MIYSLFLKRIFDIIFSFVVLCCLFPLFLFVAFTIIIFDSGPIIYKQRRIGLNGETFILYKFRSMPTGTGNVPSDKIGEIKINFIGKFIRRTNIDELPQLYNILIGDMSLVGPRPCITSQIELFELRRSNGSLLCRPGLTGLAQINSFNGMSFQQKAHYDGIYSEKISFVNDLMIILKTFLYLLKPPPIY